MPVHERETRNKLLAVLAALTALSYANDQRERKQWLPGGKKEGELENFWWLLSKYNCKTEDVKKRFLDGTHFILDDKGQIYDTLRDSPHVSFRHSSHYSQDAEQYPQLYIEGLEKKSPPIYLHILIGKTHKSNSAHTWFQVENSPWRAPSKKVKDQVTYIASNAHTAALHGYDFLRHYLRQEQLGPAGFSENTEAKPFHVPCSGL